MVFGEAGDFFVTSGIGWRGEGVFIIVGFVDELIEIYLSSHQSWKL